MNIEVPAQVVICTLTLNLVLTEHIHFRHFRHFTLNLTLNVILDEKTQLHQVKAQFLLFFFSFFFAVSELLTHPLKTEPQPVPA